LKAEGNKAMQAGNVTEAIEKYTAAIRVDGANHVYFSNRSAAYLKQGDANNALEDAEACLGLNPEFAKGYSRKGAALHAMKRYNDAIAAYEKGLDKFPNDAGLTKGINEAKRDKDGPPPGMGGMAGGLFGPQFMAQMAMNPKMRPFLNDQEVMGKIKLLQANPNLLPTMLNDPKMMMLLQEMMGGLGAEAGGDSADEPSAPSAAPKKEPEPEPMEEVVEEDLSELTPAEREKKERQRDSVEAKGRGNDLYKAKKFDEALAAYDEAIVLDETNMTFISNKAAVYFTQKKYDDCIAMCEKAVEVGKANMAPFEDRAKALTRCAKAWQKKKNLGKAIQMCEEAQLESYNKDTQRMLKTMELEKKKADKLAYLSDEKAEEAKQRGNDFFRAKQFAEAVREYEEAVKRSPKNAAIRNNLSAGLCKIMDFNGAKREIEMAVALDPKYVKAWARKGDIEIAMKENHKAMESYQVGLNLDPTNVTCKEGLRKVNVSMSASMTEEEQKERASHAMADPEIQSILTDPVIRQILNDFNENPAEAQRAMRDPDVAAKINKLIASGVVQTR
jgi:stress-induced-phosphoprotein 1